MNNTTNYELKKPEATDFYNIDDFNDNADLIDALIYEHGEGAEQESSPAGTDFLQMIGGSDSKIYKALISDIADTVLRKLAISTSETGLASGSVIEKINSLNGKTTFSQQSASAPAQAIAGNSNVWITVPLPTGKTPIALSGYYLSGGAGCAVYNMTLGSSGASFAIRNYTASQITVTVTAYYLCHN